MSLNGTHHIATSEESSLFFKKDRTFWYCGKQIDKYNYSDNITIPTQIKLSDLTPNENPEASCSIRIK